MRFLSWIVRRPGADPDPDPPKAQSVRASPSRARSAAMSSSQARGSGMDGLGSERFRVDGDAIPGWRWLCQCAKAVAALAEPVPPYAVNPGIEPIRRQADAFPP